MADYVPLENGGELETESNSKRKSPRLASLDVFRGLSIALMIYVDYAGSIFPSIAHSPWNGLRLADFVTPFFLFIAGISISLVYKFTPPWDDMTCLPLQFFSFFWCDDCLYAGTWRNEWKIRTHAAYPNFFWVEGLLLPFSSYASLRLMRLLKQRNTVVILSSYSMLHVKKDNRCQQTQKTMLRALKLFLLGILLQGGYFHGANSLTFGVDIEKMRWLGILQRIAIGYIIAAFCEIWCSSISSNEVGGGFFGNYYLHWVVMFLLSGVYLGLLHGLYVPDWQFKVQQATSNSSLHDGYFLKTVKCEVRGDLGPACNSAAMIDRYVLGTDHLYKKPAYRNLKECQISKDGQVPDDSPPWCQAPFDPEGILGSLMAAVTCIVGLQYGHVLVNFEGHKNRLLYWLLFSVSMLSLGLLLTFTGIPINKQLYSMTYMLLTTASAGFTLCLLYLLVDVCGYKWITFVVEWTGRHSLSIFVLVASNIAVIVIQGFYWRDPKNNIVHWIISLFIQR